MRNIELGGDLAGIVNILAGTAAADPAGGGAVIIELHGDADDIIACDLQHGRNDRAIDAARHGDDDAGTRTQRRHDSGEVGAVEQGLDGHLHARRGRRGRAGGGADGADVDHRNSSSGVTEFDCGRQIRRKPDNIGHGVIRTTI